VVVDKNKSKVQICLRYNINFCELTGSAVCVIMVMTGLFVPGDGAGVGKGRTIAGVIFENYLKGRKRAIWVSVSNDLKYDAERDLRDIGAAKIEVHALNKVMTPRHHLPNQIFITMQPITHVLLTEVTMNE
jgi:hypothetical protein